MVGMKDLKEIPVPMGLFIPKSFLDSSDKDNRRVDDRNDRFVETMIHRWCDVTIQAYCKGHVTSRRVKKHRFSILHLGLLYSLLLSFHLYLIGFDSVRRYTGLAPRNSTPAGTVVNSRFGGRSNEMGVLLLGLYCIEVPSC